MAREGSSVTLVRELYAALADRDLDAFAARLSEEVDWQTPSVVPWGGALRGIDAVRGYVTDMWCFFGDYAIQAESFVGRDDLVVVAGRHRGLRGAGTLHEILFSDLCIVRGGQVAAWRQQVDAGSIMRAICDELVDAA